MRIRVQDIDTGRWYVIEITPEEPGPLARIFAVAEKRGQGDPSADRDPAA